MDYLGQPNFKYYILCSDPGKPWPKRDKSSLTGPGTRLLSQLLLELAARSVWSKEATSLCPKWLLEGPFRQAQSFGRSNPHKGGLFGPAVTHLVTAERADQGYAQRCVYTGLCFLSGYVPDSWTPPVAEQALWK